MVYALNAAGFEAVGFPDGTAFWAALKKQQPELILLDAPASGKPTQKRVGERFDGYVEVGDFGGLRLFM